MNSAIWKNKFETIATKQHLIAAWVAIVLNPLWAISDYFIIPSHWKIFLAVRLAVTAATLIGVALRKKLELSRVTIVLIPFLGIALQNAYMYSVMDVPILQKHTFAYIALFIGAGMFVIWKPINSVFVILATLVVQIIFIKLFSPLTSEQILFNGGFLTITVAIFNIVLAHIRYRSVRNEVISHLELEETNKQITGQKNIIEKNAAELKDINEKLERFAYVISHDLKAPLRGVNHLASWIEEEVRDKLKPESREYLLLLRGQVEKMEKMIKGILDYSRTSGVNHSREWIDIKNLVTELSEMYILKSNVRISIFPGMPVLFCNKTNMMQVFQNLLSNAIKHNDKQKIEIKIFCIEEKDFFEFSIEDNGPGIKQQYHQHVFELFRTLSTDENADNTGVGLPIIKKIIEEKGGKIWIESATLTGTIFKFTLPKHSQKGEVLFEKMAEIISVK